MLRSQHDHLVEVILPVSCGLMGQSTDEIDADVGESGLSCNLEGLSGICGQMWAAKQAEGLIIQRLYT